MLMADYIRDNGLTKFTSEANAFVICSTEPTNYTEAFTTYKLGTKTTPTITLVAGTPNGRAASVATFTDGSITASGTAAAYAIIDTVNSRLLAAGALSSSQSVTSGNTFSITTPALIRIAAAA